MVMELMYCLYHSTQWNKTKHERKSETCIIHTITLYIWNGNIITKVRGDQLLILIEATPNENCLLFQKRIVRVTKLWI